ncbi:MAG: GNAT family N-acetyltransferase [Gemmatimonadota bacterium]|nr:GNAT family N-acetyltransferase [Gemmatimonadota bacterium]
MLPRAWSEGQIVVRTVEVAQTPALHAAVTECVDIVALDPTFAEVPESEVGELVEQSVAEEAQERGFRMRSIHVGSAEELAGYFHLMEDVPTAGDAWLSILAIRPRFRRSGVGTTLIKSLKRVLAAEGFRFALARVYLANIPALQFWTRLGFTEIVPHRGDYIGQDLGKPCIVLRASLGE